jgi:hypothetical protein
MKRIETTDFDVITGPSMASTCPIVETPPAGVIVAAEPPAAQSEAASGQTAAAPTADAA